VDKPALPGWPRLLSLKMSGAYVSVGPRVVEDWLREGLLVAIPMPGSAIRSKGGNIVTPASQRRIAKILIDRNDLDELIERRKENR
jgi:hypothetical protein